MYAKVFTSILDSSIWIEPHATRIVWFTLLLSMDADGFAKFSTNENLASRARVTLDECNAAVTLLNAPDPSSGDPEFEGRRIEKVPGGFMILNSAKYRALASDVSRRELTRLRVNRHRDKEPVTHCNAAVTQPYASASASACKGESEGKRFQPPALEEVVEEAKKSGKPDGAAEDFFNWYESNGWKVGKNPMKKWRNALARWRYEPKAVNGNGHPDIDPVTKRPRVVAVHTEDSWK